MYRSKPFTRASSSSLPKPFAVPLAIAAVLALTGCTADPDGDTGNDGTVDQPGSYAFPSRLDGESSVSYTGQVFRHILIAGLADRVGSLTSSIEDGDVVPTADGQEVSSSLLDFYAFDADSAFAATSVSIDLHDDDVPHLSLSQNSLADFGSGSYLEQKIAGHDTTGQHKEWSTEFEGWGDKGATSPHDLVLGWFAQLDTQAYGWMNGNYPTNPVSGGPISEVYVTTEGLDLQQLIQKFLLGAVAFSQGADDYLDDDLSGKGLNSDHSAMEAGQNYTALEHAWDESFGYFGATRDYIDYTNDEIAGKGGREDYAHGYHDANDDGVIDLRSEYNFGHSVNAAKRDRGSIAATDYTGGAYEGFAVGRALLASTEGPLTESQRGELAGYRDLALLNWELAIASTVVHYINDVLGDLGAWASDQLDPTAVASYRFETHAKHWSELKGFALSLQFNPRSPMSDLEFTNLQALIGEAPEIPDGSNDPAANLLAARDLLKEAYDFEAANIGGSDGTNGW